MFNLHDGGCREVSDDLTHSSNVRMQIAF